MLAKEPGQATQVALPLGLSQILTDSHSPRKVERNLKRAEERIPWNFPVGTESTGIKARLSKITR